MNSKILNLANMSAEDILRVRQQWSRTMANLPFEWKIAIVEKLNALATKNHWRERKSKNKGNEK